MQATLVRTVDDTHPAVLLVLDEGLKVNPFNLLDISLVRLSIKGELVIGCTLVISPPSLSKEGAG